LKPYNMAFGLLVVLLSSLVWLASASPVNAANLPQRIADFPKWQQAPILEPAIADLTYPKWFAGEWVMESILTEQVAPLAPQIMTPGYQQQAQYLNQPIQSQVRFVAIPPLTPRMAMLNPSRMVRSPTIGLVADRAFNGLNLARAYLGNQAVLSVNVDPQNPNRQLTQLRGDRQLISTITGRQAEQPNNSTFLTTELCQQQFQGDTQVYLNTVETTTEYHVQADPKPQIWATQLTAIYLSPQDPQYFQAKSRPVALYRYTLRLFRPTS
jgi:hypothetical protein